MLLRKKLLTLSLCIGLSLSVVACGTNDTDDTSKTDNNSSQNEQTKSESEDSEFFKEKTVAFSNDNLNVTGETAGVKYNYKSIEVSTVVPSDEYAESLEIPKGEQVTMIQLKMEAENTNDRDISFYAGGSALITNTGEQVEPHFWQPVGFDGEFLGKVKKDGEVIYILKNSKAEDIKSVELRVPAVSNTDLDDLGEELELEFKTE
ncbi:hypothetical protein [Metaclostridioides mangenotii]|uniref:hypothetical protein n=1 Tax=Metaclostridioides mangenotii TaxID=1540 RepID=UPI0004849C5A|nr:hypothetical protein [Clostridioides mangenotii]